MSTAHLKQSDYMYWAKTSFAAKYNLAVSDLEHCSLDEIPIRIGDLTAGGHGNYGYPPLVEAIGTTYGIPTDAVVTSFGASMANHVAIAAMISPGDEVLLEQPTYELLHSTAQYLGAGIRRFRRKVENDFQIDTDELRSLVSARTKLIILTNLHNPSSAYTDEATLQRIGEIAHSVGANILVDEVYLDIAFSKSPRTAYHLGKQFITTNSLTKAYGLSGLRCGWIVAEPAIAQRMWRLIDLYYGTGVRIAEQFSLAAIRNRSYFLERARSLLTTNIGLARTFFSSRDDLSAIPHVDGLVVFPKVLSAKAEDVCTILKEKYETSIVPGRFFGEPDHVRIGLGRKTEEFRQGLANVGMALDELRR